MMHINFVTTNLGKFKEVTQYIEQHCHGINIVQAALEIEEIQSLDQQEIAIYKARKAYDRLQSPVLIDDSGVYFEHFNKFPGTLAKLVYQGIGLQGLQRLYSPGDRGSMRTIFVYYAGEDNWTIGEGIIYGTFVTPDIYEGHPGFPYDQIFMPDGAAYTYAQLDQQGRKNEFSPRANALRDLLKKLTSCI